MSTVKTFLNMGRSMEMGTLLGIFTGSSKWLYIALIVCGLGLAGMTALSINLYADKAVLDKSVSDAQDKIKELKEAKDQLQIDKDNLKEVITKMEALSEQAEADAKRKAKLGAKKLQEISKSYEARLKRFKERAQNVKDYGESDSTIVDSAGI